MRKNTIIVFYLLVCLLTMALWSCTDGKQRELNRLLVELADEDATIDGGDWQQIMDFLDANKAHFKQFFDNGSVKTDEVKEYVSDLFEHRRPPKEIMFVGIGGKETLNVKFYLERSGSMLPYDAPGGDGSLKSAVVQLLNNLPGKDNRLFVVNDGVHAYPKGIDEFVRSVNIFESTKGIGDASYTDFGRIFRELLEHTGEDELSVLVSDMIYSTREMAGVNPTKVFADAQGMTQAVFKDETRRRAMLVAKLSGSYNGPYYPYDQPKGGTSYNGQRPYYIVVVGSNANIRRLTTDANYASFSRFTSLRGFEHMMLFGSDEIYKPYYSLLLSGKDIRGRFSPERGQPDRITAIEGVKPDKDSGDIRLALAVDLSGLLIEDDYLADVSNYKVESAAGFSIKEIRKVERDDATPAEKKYLKGATHIFVLEGSELRTNEELEIKLLNHLPAWVAQSSTDDDRNTAAAGFAQTTFGLKYLMQGIYDAYARHAKDEPCYFEIELKLKK